MKKLNPGLSLAELLIAIMIIGVIAALVIPALLHVKHEKEIQAGVKKIYGVLANGFNLTVQEFGNPKDWDWDSPTAVFSQFEKRLNLQKKCDTGSGCWVNKEITNLRLQDGENKNIDANTGYIKARFMDGMSLAFFANPSTPIITDSNGLRIYGVFYADVNGKKKPNEAGRDVVGFWITQKGVYRMGDGDLTEVSTGGENQPSCDDNHYFDENTRKCEPVCNPQWRYEWTGTYCRDKAGECSWNNNTCGSNSYGNNCVNFDGSTWICSPCTSGELCPISCPSEKPYWLEWFGCVECVRNNAQCVGSPNGSRCVGADSGWSSLQPPICTNCKHNLPCDICPAARPIWSDYRGCVDDCSRINNETFCSSCPADTPFWNIEYGGCHECTADFHCANNPKGNVCLKASSAAYGSCAGSKCDHDTKCDSCPTERPYWSNFYGCVVCLDDANCSEKECVGLIPREPNNRICTSCTSGAFCADCPPEKPYLDYFNGCVECLSDSDCTTSGAGVRCITQSGGNEYKCTPCLIGVPCPEVCPDPAKPYWHDYYGCVECNPNTPSGTICNNCPINKPYWYNANCYECMSDSDCIGSSKYCETKSSNFSALKYYCLSANECTNDVCCNRNNPAKSHWNGSSCVACPPQTPYWDDSAKRCTGIAP